MSVRHTCSKLPSDNNNKNTYHITKKAQSTLGFALFLCTISNNTNIQTKLTNSKPMNEKKNTFQFGFQINSLYNNGDNQLFRIWRRNINLPKRLSI